MDSVYNQPFLDPDSRHPTYGTSLAFPAQFDKKERLFLKRVATP
jgi:hypothetical protein